MLFFSLKMMPNLHKMMPCFMRGAFILMVLQTILQIAQQQNGYPCTFEKSVIRLFKNVKALFLNPFKSLKTPA